MLFIFLFSFKLWAQNSCSSWLPSRMDPHESNTTLEAALLAQTHHSLSDVTHETKVVNNKTFRLRIKPGLKFNSWRDWFPTRELNARDVFFSLARQLNREEDPWIAARMNQATKRGLSLNLQQISIISENELEIKTNTPQTNKSLMTLLAPPVGLVLSDEFNQRQKSGEKILWQPGSGEYFPESMTDFSWSLIKRDKTKKISYLNLKNTGWNSMGLQKGQCERFFDAPEKALNEFKLANISTQEVNKKSYRLALRLTSNQALPEAIRLRLSENLRPEKFKSLRGLNYLKSSNPTLPTQIYDKQEISDFILLVCRPITPGHEYLETLAQEISRELEKIFTVDIQLIIRSCQNLPLPLPNQLAQLSYIPLNTPQDAQDFPFLEIAEYDITRFKFSQNQ